MTEDEMYDIIYSYEKSEREFHERNIELENENANLRKIVKEQEELINALRAFAKTCITVEDCGIDYCPFEKICNSATREIYGDGCKLYEEMRMLGVSD